MARNPDWRTRLPFFYGWVIVGSVFANFTFIYGTYYGFSVYYVALLEEFGWSRAATAGVYSVFLIVSGLAGLVSGALLDRFGPARVMPVGGALVAAGLVATSRITQLWEFYLYFGVLTAVAFSLTAWVVSVTTISRWFSARQGMAVGFASAGIGMATVLMVPFNQYLISTVGWRTAFLVMAGMALIGVVPQTALLQVGRPENLGLKPYGSRDEGVATIARKPSHEVKVIDPEWVARPWTLGSAVQTARFWLLTCALGLAVFAQQVIFVHQAAYLVDSGYDKMLAASVVGLVGFLSIFFKVAWGTIGDVVGRERSYVGAAFALSLGIFLLTMATALSSAWVLFAYTAVFAAGYAATSSVLFPSAADVFAGKNFGSIYGAVGLGQGLGSAMGAWTAGYIFDVTGSYLLAFALAMSASVFSCACLWLAAPRKVRRVVRR